MEVNLEEIGSTHANEEPVLLPVETVLVGGVVEADLRLNLDAWHGLPVKRQSHAGDLPIGVRGSNRAAGRANRRTSRSGPQSNPWDAATVRIAQMFGTHCDAELRSEIISKPDTRRVEVCVRHSTAVVEFEVVEFDAGREALCKGAATED